MSGDFVEIPLGAEAMVAGRNFGPAVPSRFPSWNPPVSGQLSGGTYAGAADIYASPNASPQTAIAHRLWRRYRSWAVARQSFANDDFGRDPMFASRWMPRIHRLLDGAFVLARRGIDSIPPTGPAILVTPARERKIVDALMLMHMIARHRGRTIRPLMDDQTMLSPMVSVWLRRLGALRWCQSDAERLLESGTLISLPLEVPGENEPRGWGVPADAIVDLSMTTGAPILPASIHAESETGSNSATTVRFSKTRSRTLSISAPIWCRRGPPDAPASPAKLAELRSGLLTAIGNPDEKNRLHQRLK